MSHEDLVQPWLHHLEAHHVSARQKRKVKAGDMSLNLTSMIDVTFQLLIYFIITAAFTAGEGVITAKFPQGTGEKSAEKPPERKLTIRLTPLGLANRGYRIDVNRGMAAPRNFGELQFWLKQNKMGGAGSSGAFTNDTPVIIKPQGAVRWTHVVNAFTAAVFAGYENVAFAQAGAED